MSAARKRRVWTVADFALHAFKDTSPPARIRARRWLKRLDEKHAGALLIPSRGTNREYTFYPATLLRLEPDLFAPIESLELRVDALEDVVDEMKGNELLIVAQVRANSRDVARLRRTR